MARTVSDTSQRLELRLAPEDKALIARAAAIERVDLTGFVLRAVLPAAKSVIERSEHVTLSERDTLRILELLEHPPAPPGRLSRAAKAGQTLE